MVIKLNKRVRNIKQPVTFISYHASITKGDKTNKHLPHTYINLINVVYLLQDSEKFICILGVLQNHFVLIIDDLN